MRKQGDEVVKKALEKFQWIIQLETEQEIKCKKRRRSATACFLAYYGGIELFSHIFFPTVIDNSLAKHTKRR